jgi:two-component system, OmpR family, response regulator
MDRILVAEDDAALRLLYTIWLESAGFDVTQVADGRAAIEALERRPLPDAALLDVEMPFVDGLSVCRYLHALDPSIRVVVATGVEDARHYLDELVFDAVVSDYNLSEKENGAELLLEVRWRLPHARRVLYSSDLPWRMKLAAQAVAHSVIDGVRASEDLVSALAA